MFLETVVDLDLALVLTFAVEDFLASTSSDPLDESNRVLLRPTRPGAGAGRYDRGMFEGVVQ